MDKNCVQTLIFYGHTGACTQKLLKEMIKLERISVMGLGYVGLCTAVSFAVRGYQVIVSSNDSSKVRMVNEGFSPFYEPELEGMLKKGIQCGKFKAVVGREKAVLQENWTTCWNRHIRDAHFQLFQCAYKTKHC